MRNAPHVSLVSSSRLSFALAALALVACSRSQAPDNGPPPPPSPAAVPTVTDTPSGGGGGGSGSDAAEAQAVTIFKVRCSTCHGMDGKGNGPAAITLNPKPRNYTDVAWQKSVTDDHIREIIVKGGAELGKSPNMLANPDLADKPAVVDALVRKVRSFAPAAGAGATSDGGK